jgi:hypothetical protein
VTVRSTLIPPFVLALFSATALNAWADPGQQHGKRPRVPSRYELSVTEQVLAQEKLEVEPQPEGKTVEEIRIIGLAPFDRRDPIPDFLNVLHAMSKKRVLERELLFSAGQPYDSALVAESERNLRALPQLSVVLTIPVRGSAPDRVRVLVVAKDVWSLVLGWDPTLSAENFQMSAALLETNLLGTHTIVSLRGELRPESYAVGASYFEPRLAGSHIQAGVSANVQVNQDTHEVEGSFGSLSYGQPLYSLETRWAFKNYIVWREGPERVLINAFTRSYDARVTPERDRIPYEWNRDAVFASYEVVRSFGLPHKLNVGLSADLFRAQYRPPARGDRDPRALEEFQREVMPPDEKRVGPTLEITAFRAKYLQTHDLETLALEEDVQLGYALNFRASPSLRSLGSNRDVLSFYSGAGYTLPLGNGLARAVASARMDVSDEAGHDALVEGRLRITSPRSSIGRVVYDGQLGYRALDYLNQRYSLGGNNRLRGYDFGAYRGRNLVAQTVELRTRSVGVLGTQIAGAVFYDLGDAFRRYSAIDVKQSAGVGTRILLPMFNRDVFRIDWAFPLEHEHDKFPGGFVASFYQAFPLPTAAGSRIPRALATNVGAPEPKE